MIQIFATPVSGVVADVGTEVLHAALPPSKRECLGRYAHPDDRARSAVADVLARLVLSKHLGVPASALRIDNDACGRPYLRGAPAVHFSLSHAGDWAVCATSASSI